MGKKTKNRKNKKSSGKSPITDPLSAIKCVREGFHLLDSSIVRGKSFTTRKSTIAKLAPPTKTRSNPLPDVGIWSVYIRRVNYWFENPNMKSRAIPGSHSCYRDWWVSFIITDPGGVNPPMHFTGMASDSEALTLDAREQAITPTMVLAVLEKVMYVTQFRPSGLMFWPALFGAFRISSVKNLVKNFEATLENVFDFDMSEFDLCSMELAEAPMLKKRGVTCYVDPNTGDFAREHNQVIESHLQQFEEDIRKACMGEDYCRSTIIPCFTQLTDVSQYFLRQLFQSTKVFHDARVWEILSNWDPVWVTVPDLYTYGDDNVENQDINSFPTKTWIVIVSGNGSWDSRGLHFYTNFEDLQVAAVSHRGRPGYESIDLQFYERRMTPFLTLDHIAELGLDISTSGGLVDDAYPCWFNAKLTPKEMQESIDTLNNSWSRPPPSKDIPSLSLATLAIAKFGSDTRYCELIGSKRKLAQNEVSIQIEIPSLRGGSGVDLVNATVHARNVEDKLNGMLMSMEQMEHSMTFGTDMCNFCQKPKSILDREGKKLLTCSRCKQMYYCSRQCQKNDWVRHRRKCKLVSGSST